MIKCNIGDCVHEGWWVCLRCGFTICGECHDGEELPDDNGDNADYCPSCAEYHEDWKENAWLRRSTKE